MSLSSAQPGSSARPTPDTQSLPEGHPLHGPTAEAPLIRAYRGQRPATTPVWFMRQAGRSLPEYRELRTGTRMLDACLDPELVTEITMQPVRRHGVDAAIFFSDIVVPLKIAGVDVDIVPGKGPVLAHPVRTSADVAALRERTLTTDALEPIVESIRRLTAELGSTPLIGFAGAPFTLAAYLVEGGPSKDQLSARSLMHAQPEVWADLMSWIAELTGTFLTAQIRAGASAAQLFDSWAGGLSLADYRAFVAPYSAQALTAVRALGDVPTVHFGVGTGHLLGAMHEVGVDVVGVDWRTPLDQAAAALPGVPLQGNIDPAMLSAGLPALTAHTSQVLESGRAAPAHVLNLGHGVPPDTDPEVLTRLVTWVHEQDA
ncbi:uroporphyrinogen decarboxylase [Ruania halotolerans]|uniref:uroporphyrinogen decarboxylase n=1 Tax=Ruania halotolerans TaxID=2897773 RepID=UPI001E3CF2B0|nr:uroporphyrinogen decarboxylase [Ruania halotolerans]UFU07779.1 uroporphyrinogen decarboxylase [Ruania halotolerans]